MGRSREWAPGQWPRNSPKVPGFGPGPKIFQKMRSKLTKKFRKKWKSISPDKFLLLKISHHKRNVWARFGPFPRVGARPVAPGWPKSARFGPGSKIFQKMRSKLSKKFRKNGNQFPQTNSYSKGFLFIRGTSGPDLGPSREWAPGQWPRDGPKVPVLAPA